jgi:hypothetical protein
MGIITGVLVHLIRCIDTTPLVVSPHVKESLALLKMREVQQRFGWMVLHDLNIDADHAGSSEDGTGTDSDKNILEEVQEKDGLDVLRSLGVGRNNSRQRKRRRKAPGSDPSIAYPLGTMPTWTELVKAIRENPSRIMRSWSYNSIWTASAIAAQLFIKFSQQMWLFAHPAWTGGDDRSFPTLQEAMKSWSIESIDENLSGIVFLPCNAKVKGAPRGRPEKSFSERAKIYFPDDKDDRPPTNSPWGNFWKYPCYIWEYHRTLHDLDDEDDVENLDGHLKDLFQNIQCLPNSQGFTASFAGRLWSKSKEDGLEVVTNPVYYKIVEVGAIPRRGKSRGTRKPATRTKKAFISALLRQEGMEEEATKIALAEERKKKCTSNARKSAKSKAYRAPPTRRQTNPKKVIRKAEGTGMASDKHGSTSPSRKKKKSDSESEDGNGGEGVQSDEGFSPEGTTDSDPEDGDEDPPYIYDGEDEDEDEGSSDGW